MDNSKEKLNRIMKLALSVEATYNVGIWKVNGVHLWPLIKHVAYFDYKKDKSSKSKFLSKIFSRIFFGGNVYFSRFRKKDLSNLKQADLLFCGANSHYVTWKGKNHNRYFDPILENINISSVQINYSLFNLSNLPTYVLLTISTN